jgi:hypothetical protein
MAEKFKLSVTRPQEEAVEAKFGFSAGTVAEMLQLRFKDSCYKDSHCPTCEHERCGLTLNMVERKLDGSVIVPPHTEEEGRTDRGVATTDVTVECINPECPHPELVTELGETLLRAFGQAPALET